VQIDESQICSVGGSQIRLFGWDCQWAPVGSRNQGKEKRVILKKAAVVGFAGLALGASPAAADSVSDGSTVVFTMVGGLGVTSIGCLMIALLTQDDEDDEEGYDRRGLYVALSASYARENFSDSAVVDFVNGASNDSLRSLRGTPTFTNAKPPQIVDPGDYRISFGDLDDETFGFTGRVGYRCHPYVSVELQFESLDNFDGSIVETENPLTGGAPMNGNPPDSLRGLELRLETLVFTTNVKVHLLTGRYQPFVLAGAGFMRMEGKVQGVTGGTIAGFAPQERVRRVDLAMRFGGGIDIYLTENVVASAEVSYLLMPTGRLDNLDYYSIGVGLQYRF